MTIHPPCLISCGQYFLGFIDNRRALHTISTISSVVDNFYAQPIDIVDNFLEFVEIRGIFCYDRYVFVVDYF